MIGHSLKKNIDHNEIFSPIFKLIIIQILLSIIEKMEFKITFLPRSLDKEIYYM